MKETNIDCMKYRKSTHLAGVDVEMIIAEKGKCILTIKQAYYEKGVNVSGNKTDGYFIDFEEDVKPMVVNSGNRLVIAEIVKNAKNITLSEARNIGLWTSQKIELYFDSSVKMMGQVVGGIKVKKLIELTPNHELWQKIKQAIKDKKYTIEQVRKNYSINPENEKLLCSN
jgi:hypothetical protein